MAAVAPAQLSNPVKALGYNLAGEDADAEGEDEEDYQTSAQAEDRMSIDSAFNANEGKDEGNESDEDDAAVGAVKIPKKRARIDSDEDAVEEDQSEDQDSSGEDEDDSEKGSSDAESVVAGDWEGGSEGADNDETETANRNNCV